MLTFTENTVLTATLSNLKASIKEDTLDARTTGRTTTDSRRCKLLAYTFLKGRTYFQVESNPRYLRDGFYGYADSLRYERDFLVKKIAAHIPEDVGDGVSRADMLKHLRMWLEVGAVTRNQILADMAGIAAVQDKMNAVGVAQGVVKDWDAKVTRITNDLAYAKAWTKDKEIWDKKIVRYEADLAYTVTQQEKAKAKLAEAQAALDAVKAVAA